MSKEVGMGFKRLEERYTDRLEAWKQQNHVCYLLIALARAHRKNHSLQQFAAWIGIDPTTVGKWFNETRPVTREHIVAMYHNADDPAMDLVWVNRLLATIGGERYSPGEEDDELPEFQSRLGSRLISRPFNPNTRE
jgi:hypothetical protein